MRIKRLTPDELEAAKNQLLAANKVFLHRDRKTGLPVKEKDHGLKQYLKSLDRFRGFVPIEELPFVAPAKDNNPQWRKKTHTEVIDHVISHLDLEIRDLLRYGVPVFDLEILSHTGANVSYLMEWIYEPLRTHYYSGETWRHRTDTLLLKTLSYIQALELAKVNWDRVELTVPNARKETFNLETDLHGGRMFVYAATE